MRNVDARHGFLGGPDGGLVRQAIFARHGVQKPRVISREEYAALQAARQQALAGYKPGETLPEAAWITPVAVKAPVWNRVSRDPDHPFGAQTGQQLTEQSPEQAASRERDAAVPILDLVREHIAVQQADDLALKHGPKVLANYAAPWRDGQYLDKDLQALGAVYEARARRRQEGRYSYRAIDTFELLTEQTGRIDRMHQEWEQRLVENRAVIEGGLTSEIAPAKKELLGRLTTTLFSASPVGINRLRAEYGEHHRELARFARQADILRSNGTSIADRVLEYRAELVSRRNAVQLRINERQVVTSDVLKEAVGAFGTAYSSLSDRTILRVLGIAIVRDQQGQPVYVAGKRSLAGKFLRAKAMKELAALQFTHHLGDGTHFDREAIGGIMGAAVQKLTQEREEIRVSGKIALKFGHALRQQATAVHMQQEVRRVVDLSKQAITGLRRRAA